VAGSYPGVRERLRASKPIHVKGKTMKEQNSLAMTLRIEQIIRMVRGQRVILDSDLAAIYGVSTKALNQAVKRNADRFPDDFVFRLTPEETIHCLRSQYVTSNEKADRSQSVTGSRGGRRYYPYVFTEHGALMAANVLRSPREPRASYNTRRRNK
jgi:hypothetical protein